MIIIITFTHYSFTAVIILKLFTINIIAKLRFGFFKKSVYISPTTNLLESIQEHRPLQSHHFVDLPSSDIQTFLGQRKSVCLPVHRIVFSRQRVVIQLSFWDKMSPVVPWITTHCTHLLPRHMYLSTTREKYYFKAAFVYL